MAACQGLDKSESGNLTLQELVQGAQRDAEFQSRLRVMDIDADDLEQFFRMIDADDSGSIEPLGHVLRGEDLLVC